MKQDLLGSVILLATLCLFFFIRSFILSAGRHPRKQVVLKSAERKNEHSGEDTGLGVSQDHQKPVGYNKPMAGKYARPERHKE